MWGRREGKVRVWGRREGRREKREVKMWWGEDGEERDETENGISPFSSVGGSGEEKKREGK